MFKLSSLEHYQFNKIINNINHIMIVFSELMWDKKSF